MKFLRVGQPGSEIPCVLDDAGVARDVSSVVPDYTPATIPGLVDRMRGVDLGSLPAVDTSESRIAPPVNRPANIYCIGLNYSDHAAEAGMDIPEEPILFNKSSGTFCGPNDPIPYSPRMSKASRSDSTEISWAWVASGPSISSTRQP